MGTKLTETCREAEINILRSSVHPVGFIWKRLYRDARSTKHKKKWWTFRRCLHLTRMWGHGLLRGVSNNWPDSSTPHLQTYNLRSGKFFFYVISIKNVSSVFRHVRCFALYEEMLWELNRVTDDKKHLPVQNKNIYRYKIKTFTDTK